MDFNVPDSLLHFKTRDDFLNASSAELAMQSLYGDYILLFPASELASGLALTELRDFFLRFDFLSIDNTPPPALMLATEAWSAPTADRQRPRHTAPALQKVKHNPSSLKRSVAISN